MPTTCYVLSVDGYRLIQSLLVRIDVDVNEQDILPKIAIRHHLQYRNNACITVVR